MVVNSLGTVSKPTVTFLQQIFSDVFYFELKENRCDMLKKLEFNQ